MKVIYIFVFFFFLFIYFRYHFRSSSHVYSKIIARHIADPCALRTYGCIGAQLVAARYAEKISRTDE